MADQRNHKLNVVHKGELEGITKPASGSRSRSGSRVTQQVNNSASSAARVNSRVSAASLEFLSPEQISRQDFDLELEDYGSSGSEYTTDEEFEDGNNVNTCRTSEIFHIAEPLTDRSKKNNNLRAAEANSDDDDYDAARQIALLEADTEIDVDSEEERDIIREIKAEITQQVRTEMQDEIAIYQEARERLSSATKGQKENADLEDMEPKLREAFIKMRKLDRILLKKIKREKQVKRDRILLQRRLRDELAAIKPEGRDETKEVQTNTEKFLALTLPPSHNEGVSLVEFEEVDSPQPVTPVFQTQVIDDTTRQEQEEGRQTGQRSQGDGDGHSSATSGSRATGSCASGSTETNSQASSRAGKKKRKKNRDFIKRNIQLAADAGNAIAMTDDEKKRLEDLLTDLDALPDIPEEGLSVEMENPYQITLSQGEGFYPTHDEMRRLEAIDERLKSIMPPEDFESIASATPRSVSSQQSTLFTRTALHTADDAEQLGEWALKETRENRDLKSRLKDIEEELGRLTTAVESEMESPKLSDNQLQDLLDQCSRTMSRATAETDSIAQTSRASEVSSRSSLYENPPKLPEDVLQQLLAEARQSLPDSHHSNNRLSERENLILESINEETMRDLMNSSRAASRARSSELTRSSSSLRSAKSQNGYHGAEDRPWSRHSDSDSRLNDRRPFLPEIDPKGTLSTQKPSGFRLNNEDNGSRRPPSSGRLSAVTVHNSLSEERPNNRTGFQSHDQGFDQSRNGTPNPRPPSGGRKSKNNTNMHRTISPQQ